MRILNIEEYIEIQQITAPTIKQYMDTINISGEWTGIIVLGKGYLKHKGKEVYFDAEIKHEDNLINGFATDIKGYGINPDSAMIEGTFIDNEISFIKQYPSLHYHDRNGKFIIDRSKQGPKIYYKGTYDKDKQEFVGDWIMSVILKLFLFIPIKFSGTGTWSMKIK